MNISGLISKSPVPHKTYNQNNFFDDLYSKPEYQNHRFMSNNISNVSNISDVSNVSARRDQGQSNTSALGFRKESRERKDNPSNASYLKSHSPDASRGNHHDHSPSNAINYRRALLGRSPDNCYPIKSNGNDRTLEKEREREVTNANYITNVFNTSKLEEKSNYIGYKPANLTSNVSTVSLQVNKYIHNRSKSELNLTNKNDPNSSKNVSFLNASKISGTNQYVDLLQNKNLSNLNVSNIQGNPQSAKGYLDRRHNESKEKIEKMRKEKLYKENVELSFKPEISKNSQKIIEKISRDMLNNKSAINSTPLRDQNKDFMKRMQNTIEEMNRIKQDINIGVDPRRNNNNANANGVKNANNTKSIKENSFSEMTMPSTATMTRNYSNFDVEQAYRQMLLEKERTSSIRNTSSKTPERDRDRDRERERRDNDKHSSYSTNDVCKVNNYLSKSPGYKDNTSRNPSPAFAEPRQHQPHNNQPQTATANHITQYQQRNFNYNKAPNDYQPDNKSANYQSGYSSNVSNPNQICKIQPYYTTSNPLSNQTKEQEQKDRKATTRPESSRSKQSSYQNLYSKALNEKKGNNPYVNQSPQMNQHSSQPNKPANNSRPSQNSTSKSNITTKEMKVLSPTNENNPEFICNYKEDGKKRKNVDLNNVIPVTASKNIDFQSFDLFSPPSNASNIPKKDTLKTTNTYQCNSSKSTSVTVQPDQAGRKITYQTFIPKNEAIPKSKRSDKIANHNESKEYDIVIPNYYKEQQNIVNYYEKAQDHFQIQEQQNYAGTGEYNSTSKNATSYYSNNFGITNKSNPYVNKDMSSAVEDRKQDLNKFQSYIDNINKQVESEVARLETFNRTNSDLLNKNMSQYKQLVYQKQLEQQVNKEDQTSLKLKLDEVSKRYLSSKLNELSHR